ncbi:MAG: hypothetical protein RLZZ324_947 [Candidatus Parcubacteria bacterium]|jgi:hypothetical protein
MSIRITVLGIATFALATLATSAHANAHDWSGTEVIAHVSGDLPFKDSPFGLRVHATRFMIPSKDVSLSFFYVGPTWTGQAGGFSLWVSPQFATSLGFLTSDAFGPALWSQLDYAGKANLFMDLEHYSGLHGGNAWYGLYSGNWTPASWFNLGAQAEHVDLGLHVGPHVGMTVGPFHGEVQYYYGAINDTANALRLVTALRF